MTFQKFILIAAIFLSAIDSSATTESRNAPIQLNNLAINEIVLGVRKNLNLNIPTPNNDLITFATESAEANLKRESISHKGLSESSWEDRISNSRYKGQKSEITAKFTADCGSFSEQVVVDLMNTLIHESEEHYKILIEQHWDHFGLVLLKNKKKDNCGTCFEDYSLSIAFGKN